MTTGNCLKTLKAATIGVETRVGLPSGQNDPTGPGMRRGLSTIRHHSMV